MELYPARLHLLNGSFDWMFSPIVFAKIDWCGESLHEWFYSAGSFAIASAILFHPVRLTVYVRGVTVVMKPDLMALAMSREKLAGCVSLASVNRVSISALRQLVLSDFDS